MHIECNTVVDYLFQQRKQGRPGAQGITLFRNGQLQICLGIGKGSKMVHFKLEESLSKVYSGFINDGKCTIELKLAGGSTCNIIISKANPNHLNELVKILNIIDQQPDRAHEIDLRKNLDGENDEDSENDD
ncbi:hypothetical protein RB653_000767 [Dictyostelium firmibasis]|uniref:PIF1/LRR1 pleckstrin homology domain-containing protein n=1 Tax=Dictyostelium firmibasis TaxID=79012 RepID=A0AAN7UFS7_9MYCE